MNEKGQATGAVVVAVFAVLGILAFFALFWAWPTYMIWQREQVGRAQLAEAEWSKRIAVEEAKARLESETLNAQAEVERAKGVAESNRIIGDSLQGKEEYLRYLYITGLKDNQNKEIIYVPTEAGIPILEANRLQPTPQPQR